MRNRSCVERLVFIVFALAILQPGYGMSDEARVALEKLKKKVTTSGSVQHVQHPEMVAELEDETTSAVIKPTDRKVPSFAIGSSKKAVINCLGTPIHDGGHYLKFGLQEAVYLENDRVVSWHGFSESDDKFDISDRQIAVKPTNINPKTGRPHSYRATHRQKEPKEDRSIFSLCSELLESSTTSTSDILPHAQQTEQTIEAKRAEEAQPVVPIQPVKAANFKIRPGNDKATVIKTFGNPPAITHYGRKTLFTYGKQVVLLEDDRVINWDGFDKDDPRFENSKKPSSPINVEALSNGSINNANCSSSTNYSGSQTTRPRLSNGDYTTRTGPRGGKYHISASGKKVYHKKR